MKKYLFLVIFLPVIGLTKGLAQNKFYNDKSLSSITYFMTHPLHEWSGTSKDFTSVIVADATRTKISQVAVSAKLSTFDSQNANRDSHMIEVTDGIKYPTISFASTSIIQNGEKLSVTGDLTFHGVKQKIMFDANLKTTGNKIEITGNFTVTLTQFKIEAPTLMGVATNNEIKISFDVTY